MKPYSNKEMLWIALYFSACIIIGFLLAWRFPMDDSNYSRECMIEPFYLKLSFAGLIAAFLFLVGGFLKGKFL